MLQHFLRFAEKTADFLCDLRKYGPPLGNQGSRPLVIAHRGAWGRESCFENTMDSFRRARDLGADGIEFDVRFTRDGFPVVHHDPSLHRIFRHPGLLESMTLGELRSVTADLPRLEEVLDLGGLHFMIEIKVPLDARRMDTFVSCLGAKEPLKDFHLLALQPGLVKEHGKLPPASWMLVGELDLRSRIRLSLEKGYGGVAGHYLGMHARDIERLHAAKQKAGVGFVPSENLYNREWARGADFVFTNSMPIL